MRVFCCLIPLLCGCSTPTVRCDAHLQPINPPAPVGTPTVSAKGAAATPASAAPPFEPLTSEPSTARRSAR